MQLNPDTLFAIGAWALIVSIALWHQYIKYLRKHTIARIHKFCYDEKIKRFEVTPEHRDQIKLYRVYVHESENSVELGVRKEITLTGFTLEDALITHYLALSAMCPTAYLRPIAAIQIEPLISQNELENSKEASES